MSGPPYGNRLSEWAYALAVASELPEKVGARPEAVDRAVAQHQHFVDTREERQPVDDDNERDACALELRHGLQQCRFALAIEARVGLIEHHEARFAVQSAR